MNKLGFKKILLIKNDELVWFIPTLYTCVYYGHELIAICVYIFTFFLGYYNFNFNKIKLLNLNPTPNIWTWIELLMAPKLQYKNILN